MDLNMLDDVYNALLAHENNMGEENLTGESDVVNFRSDNSISENEENEVNSDTSCPEEEENISCHNDNNDDSSMRYSSSSDEINAEATVNVDDITPQSMTPTPLLEPFIGMEFDTEEDAYNHYNSYAKEIGFSVRKHRVNRSKVDNHVLSRSFVCSNEGEKYSKDKRRKGIDYKPRVTKKTQCLAEMRIKFKDGKFVVYLLEKEHNHQLVNPSESYRLRSHQKFSRGTVELIERLRKSGIRHSQIMTFLNDIACGEQHAGVSDDRCRNLFRSRQRKSIGIDCQQAINYLDSMRASDGGFFYAVRVNEDQELTGIFWVDSRAREQYLQFGDVIVFDTTYRKNKYKFPFAPFTGVNHHMQSILFGCGLIADETKESFIWLFQNWLQAMHNIQPMAILTDEDQGIMKAIKLVFPSSVHRLCEWHLQKHRLSHLRPLYRRHQELKQIYDSCVNDSITSSDFEERWVRMLQRYNLEDNKWLKKQFKIRRHWIPCYFHDIFFAGMCTTQRGESMNNYFKGFFSPSTPVSAFVTQYEEAVKKRRRKEAKEDVKCITSNPSCSSNHSIEKQAADTYTEKVFKVFKDEWSACIGLGFRQCDSDFPNKRYQIFSRDGEREINVEYVVDNQDAEVTTCSCKKFEYMGLLCRHILKVYVITDRRYIPQHYILPRWTKDARYDRNGSGSAESSSERQPLQPVWLVHDIAHRVATEASLSEERFDFVLKALTETLKEVLKMEASVSSFAFNLGQRSGIHVDHNCPRVNDPRDSLTRGRPKVIRYMAAVENFIAKRAYHCSGCNSTGHNVQRCPQVNAPTKNDNTTHITRPMHIDLNDPPLPCCRSFVQAHPNANKTCCERLCHILDCKKLSMKACSHGRWLSDCAASQHQSSPSYTRT